MPDNPIELVRPIQMLVARGSIRLTTDAIPVANPLVTSMDNDIWNRDGSAQTGFNPVLWLTDLAASAALTPNVNP